MQGLKGFFLFETVTFCHDDVSCKEGGSCMDNPGILVVDDDREIVNAISINLENEGYRVYKAYDGLQALVILATHSIQLILLDIMMPRLDACRRP